MLAQTSSLHRIPVAFFNMKHFRCRQKHLVTPSTISSIFTKYLDPQDRLLRQSRAGGGSTRVLVLDQLQHVKGVYHPLLCLPHPFVVQGGEQVLGLPVKDYIHALAPQTSEAASMGDQTVLPAVLLVLSHPHGLALTSFTADGNMWMPLVNLSPRPASAAGLATPSASPNPITSELVESLVQVIDQNYEQYLSKCSTYYFIVKDGNSSFTLTDLKNGEKVLKEKLRLKMDPFSKMLAEDSRWIILPDVVLQTSQRFPLYVHDGELNKKVVSSDGLSKAVASGSLELDVTFRKPDAAAVQKMTAD